MKKLDRYLVKSFIGPFFAVLFVVVFALSLQFLWVYIDDLVGKGLGLGVIFEFLGWAAMTLLPMSIPLATLLASIMTLGGLGEKNELLAMKAAGISLQRIITPVIVLSALISVGAFFTSNNLVPVAYNKIYTLFQDISNTKDEIKIPTGTFYDGIEGYILRVDSSDEQTGMMYDLMIYDHTSNKGNTSMTLADSGKIHVTPDKQNLIFDLYNGCSYSENNKMTYRDTSLELSRSRFTSQNLIIKLENYSFSRSNDDKFSDEIMSSRLGELRVMRDSIAYELDSLVRRQHKRFVGSSGLKYLYQIDTVNHIPFDCKGKIELDSVYSSNRNPDHLIIWSDAVSNAGGAVEQAGLFENERMRDIELIRKIDIESFRKFTLSLACLLFFFIGAPLGAIIRKGGLGTPVIISVFFYLVYYIIDIIGKKLAKNGALTPLTGTVISSLVLLPIGIFLTRKSTQDSALFNLDSYKEDFRSFWKKLSKSYYRFMNIFRKGGSKIRIVYMGTPEFAVAPLDALLSNNFEIAAVVTTPDKPSGRGLMVNESAVKKYAVEHNIPVLQPEKLKDPAFLEALQALKANLFVVVAFRMLPREVWSMPALGTFNLHASLLPQYRGAAPINWAIINGEKFSGVTTFMIDENIDTGKIIFQDSCTIEPYFSAGDLHDRLMKMGAELVLKTVDAIENRQAKPYEQSLDFDKELKPAPKITKELCHIDWNDSVSHISHLIRGLNPYPGAYTTMQRGDEIINVKMYEAYDAKIPDIPDMPVGSVLPMKDHLQIKCGDGFVRIHLLQISGKKKMKITDFLRGFREIETYRFV